MNGGQIAHSLPQLTIMIVWYLLFYLFFFFFSSRRRHTRLQGDWSSDVCSSDLAAQMLCTAHRMYNLDDECQDIPYKKAHVNHPSTIDRKSVV